MKLPAGFKDLRTSLPGIVTGFGLFVALNPSLFPEHEPWAQWVRALASFIAGPGAVALGFAAASTHKVKEKAEEKAVALKQETAQIIDAKVEQKIEEKLQ